MLNTIVLPPLTIGLPEKKQVLRVKSKDLKWSKKKIGKHIEATMTMVRLRESFQCSNTD